MSFLVLNSAMDDINCHDQAGHMSLLSLSKCPNGSFRRILGIRTPVFPPAVTVERNR